VTAASEHAALDRERAETYLRLQAEAELRRALAMPEYKPPRQRTPQFRLIANSRRMRRRRAILDRFMRQHARAATASSQSRPPAQSKTTPIIAAMPVIRQAAKSLGGAPKAVGALTATMRWSATRTWHGLSRLLANSVISTCDSAVARVRAAIWRRGFVRHQGYKPPPAAAGLARVEAIAGVLAAVGAITAETEEDVVGGLREALAARSRIDHDALFGYHRFGGHTLVSTSTFIGHPMRRMAGGTAAPSGPPRAIPVGASATGEIDGVPVRFYLGALVFDQGGAALTVRARFPAELEERDDGFYDALSDISAVDDRGGAYRAGFSSGGGGAGEWDARLQLSPAPPPGVRWLDMTVPGAPAVRVRLDATPRDLQITTEQVTTSAADRFLDAQTIRLLARQSTDLDWPSDDDPDVSDDGDLLPLLRIARHLVAAGVLRTDSPSLRRLAAAAAQSGTPLPDPLAAIEATDLPAGWLSLLSRADCTDGPTGAIPIAVVLPEVDGVQCVIVELVSDSESATVQVHARGWPEPREPFGVRSDQIWWTARDDLGGGYVVREGSSSYGNDEADLDLEISPAINPKARVLDIILTGTTTQVTASVPLDWQEGL
jgi:hypothetical protein